MNMADKDANNAAAATTIIDPTVLTDLVAAITAKTGIGDAANVRSRNDKLHEQ